MLCQMCDINKIVGGMPWPKTHATNYHAQVKLSDKDHAIKELVA